MPLCVYGDLNSHTSFPMAINSVMGLMNRVVVLHVIV
jgi:hypothetical protein